MPPDQAGITVYATARSHDSSPAPHPGGIPTRAAAARLAVPAARPAGRGPVMAKIGYARVSTRGQNDDSQFDDLTAYGCEKIFTDTASGKHAALPELDKALTYLRKDDVFVITRLSRAMRSLKHLLALADELRDRSVGLERRSSSEVEFLRVTG